MDSRQFCRAWELHGFFCTRLCEANRLKTLRHVFLWGYRFLSVFIVCLFSRCGQNVSRLWLRILRTQGKLQMEVSMTWREGSHFWYVRGEWSLDLCLARKAGKEKKAKVQPLYFPYAALFPRPRLFIVCSNNFSP